MIKDSGFIEEKFPTKSENNLRWYYHLFKKKNLKRKYE
jgi:hypothetical protein